MKLFLELLVEVPLYLTFVLARIIKAPFSYEYRKWKDNQPEMNRDFTLVVIVGVMWLSIHLFGWFWPIVVIFGGSALFYFGQWVYYKIKNRK